MPNNDYIIAVDEAGQPYIAHANGQHKYIQKIRYGPKTLYFYTLQQIQNFLARQRSARLMKQQKANQNTDWQSNRPTSHQKNITGSAKAGWNTRRTYDH